MLKISQLTNNTSVIRLVQFWAQRYTPDLSLLSLAQNKLESDQELVKAASAAGRALTTAKLNEYLIEIKCQMARLQTNNLYAYIPNIVDLAESKRIAKFAFLVYQKLMQIYEQHPDNYDNVDSLRSCPSSWGILAIEELAKAIEPLLLEFQMQHIASKDWRTLGFITTLLNFANELLLYKLTIPEQVLLKPYFRFIEEQVALPWQRVCAAAAPYQIDSPAFRLVEQMFPLSREIAEVVYRRLVQLLPNHRSRRGGLDDPGITHSCLRDLEMFQAYLWLCFLENSMISVTEELVDLCVMVMTGVDVKWEMIELWNKLLMDEVLTRVKPAQKMLLLPYTQGLQQAFLNKRDRFQETLNNPPLFPEPISFPTEQTLRKIFFSKGIEGK